MVKKKTRKKEQTSERKELLWRIFAGIVSGIILGVWRWLITILTLVNFIIVLFTNKRNKEVADLCGIWNSEMYRYIRYLTFETNERPFPFNNLKRYKKVE